MVIRSSCLSLHNSPDQTRAYSSALTDIVFFGLTLWGLRGN